MSRRAVRTAVNSENRGHSLCRSRGHRELVAPTRKRPPDARPRGATGQGWPAWKAPESAERARAAASLHSQPPDRDTRASAVPGPQGTVRSPAPRAGAARGQPSFLQPTSSSSGPMVSGQPGSSDTRAVCEQRHRNLIGGPWSVTGPPRGRGEDVPSATGCQSVEGSDLQGVSVFRGFKGARRKSPHPGRSKPLD